MSKTLHQFEFLPPNVDIEDSSQELAYLLLNLKFNSTFWNEATNWNKLWNWRLMKAVFGYRDEALLAAARKLYAKAMAYLFEQFCQTDDNPQLHDHLHNCLCLLPYLEWQTGDIIQLPQLVDGSWELLDFHIERIALLPRSGFLSLWTRPYDECYAYGLVNEKHSRAYFVFSGTTYPAGQGFRTHIQEDSKPFQTPGATLFYNAIPQITEWMKKAPSHLTVVGMSLGGAMALQMAMAFPECISEVSALNPPGLETYFAHPHDRWDNVKDALNSKVRIILQGQDPVSCYGIFKPDWTLVQYKLPPKDDVKNPVLDHTLTYTGIKDTSVVILNTVTENNKRRSHNFWIYTIVRLLVYGLVVLPWIFLINPLWHFIQDHLWTILLTVLLITLHVQPEFLIPLAMGFFIVELLKLVFNLENSAVYRLVEDISNQSFQSQMIRAGVIVASIIPFVLVALSTSPVSWLILPIWMFIAVILNHATQQVFGIHENLCDEHMISKKNQL